MSEPRIGVYVCHCGTNIGATVDVEATAKFAATLPNVAVARHDRFMCSQPGQEKIRKDIEKLGLNRVVVAACSPNMHETTFRRTCERAGLNGYLCQIANIREQCSWVHSDRAAATAKAQALVSAAARRVALQQALEVSYAPLNPATLVVGAGIAGIQASLELAQTGHPVYLVERDSTIGGRMAKFDKTFPTLDCAACILTPKMVQVTQKPNIHLRSMTDVEKVSGTFGSFTVTLRRRARYVTPDCTACGACSKVCPVTVPSTFDEFLGERTAIHRSFPQAIPSTFVIDKQERSPCRGACPLGLPAGGVVALAAKGKFKEAARLLRTSNPLANVTARVCHRPCETECNRTLVDEALAIRPVERFVLEWARAKRLAIKPPKVAPRTERVAVVGSGAAGLACAADLAGMGYRVTLFEKEPVLGGQLALGIPSFRLPRTMLEEDLAWIRGLGVEFRTGTALVPDAALATGAAPELALAADGGARVGGVVSIASLRADGFSAVFLATGFNRPRPLGVPGEQLRGVVTGLSFLRAVNLGLEEPLRSPVVVIGADDVALDAARAARRKGAAVTLICGPGRAMVAAQQRDLKAAQAEGVVVRCRTDVVSITGTDAVTGVHVRDIVITDTDQGPVEVEAEGSERLIPCETVLVAVGEVAEPGLEPLADPETKQTETPWVFAANLASHGPTALAHAIAAGRRAAEAVDKFITGKPLAAFTTRQAGAPRPKDAPPRPHRLAPLYEDTPRKPRVRPAERAGAVRVHDWDEVHAGFSEAEAVAEASRCLTCGVCVECQECERVCEPGAVRHDMTDEFEELAVGQVLLATGYQMFDAKRMPQYGYGRFPDVYNGLEFERMLNSAGPTGGKVVCRNGQEPRAVMIVHCVGSRNMQYHRYCSKVCCMYALKFAHLVKDRTGAEVYQLYIDMRSDGKGFEEFYVRVLDEGSRVIRGAAAEVLPARGAAAQQGTMVVRAEDTLLGKVREIPVDMVLLCAAVEPQHDADRIRSLFSISMSPDGFFLERHPKLDPTSTFTDGIFIAGTCQGPKDIPDTVAQASGAAARMMGNIAVGQVTMDPVRALVDEAKCGGCRLCNTLCPYNAIEFLPQAGVSRVTTSLCKGCGTCVAACPAGAIAGAGFTDEQILAELEGLMAVA